MSSRIFQIIMWSGLHLVHWPKARIDPNMGWHGGRILHKILPWRRNSNTCNSASNQAEERWRLDEIYQKVQGHSTWLLWSLRGKDTGRDCRELTQIPNLWETKIEKTHAKEKQSHAQNNIYVVRQFAYVHGVAGISLLSGKNTEYKITATIFFLSHKEHVNTT